MKLIISLLFVFIAQNLFLQDLFISEKIIKKWETTNDLKIPESVLYDPSGNIFYVSNINGEPLDKDKNGFISKVSLDGKIIELKWVSDLDAPKGMGIYNGKLYVSDIDYVAEIDIITGKILNKYHAEGATFLNDITVNSDGEIFISDMGNQALYSIKRNVISLWLRSDKIKNVNGLWAEKDRLLAGTSDKIISIDYKEKKINDFILNTGNIDGLVSLDNARYLISDWQGSVHIISKGKDKEKILDTSKAGINAADIEYLKDKKLLLVPTFGDNRVMAYSFK